MNATTLTAADALAEALNEFDRTHTDRTDDIEMWDLITGSGHPWSPMVMDEPAARDLIGDHESNSVVVLAHNGEVVIIRVDESAGEWIVQRDHA